MELHIKDLEEGCCKKLNSFQEKLIDGDTLDQNCPTCDIVVDCNSKYILIEEKSLFLDFFRRFAERNHKKFAYYINKGKINKEFFYELGKANIDEKREILLETLLYLFSSSLNKVSNTTHILTSEFNKDKVKCMPIVYLYCESNIPYIDDLIKMTWYRIVSADKQQILVSCGKLEKFLIKKGCL